MVESLSPLRSLAVLSGKRPIEVVTIGFVIATLAYFQLLSAVKHSEFLKQPSSGSNANGWSQTAREARLFSATNGTLLQRSAANVWSHASAKSHGKAIPTISVAQIQLVLDASTEPSNARQRQPSPRIRSTQALSQSHNSGATAFTTSDQENIVSSIRDFEEKVKSTSFLSVSGSSPISFESICYQAPAQSYLAKPGCLAISFQQPANGEADNSATTAEMALAFQTPESAREWTESFLASSPLAELDKYGYSYMSEDQAAARSNGRSYDDAGLGLQFSAFPHLANAPSEPSYSENDAQSVTWMLYAARAFFLRFYALARVGWPVSGSSSFLLTLLRFALCRKLIQQTSLS